MPINFFIFNSFARLGVSWVSDRVVKTIANKKHLRGNCHASAESSACGTQHPKRRVTQGNRTSVRKPADGKSLQADYRLVTRSLPHQGCIIVGAESIKEAQKSGGECKNI